MTHKKTFDFISSLSDPAKRVELAKEEIILLDVETIEATPSKIRTIQKYKKLYEEIISSEKPTISNKHEPAPLTINDAAGEEASDEPALAENVIPENYIAVTLISNGAFHSMAFPVDRLGEFAEKLRKEGPTPVLTSEREFIVDGLIVPAKGSKNTLMIIPETEEGAGDA